MTTDDGQRPGVDLGPFDVEPTGQLAAHLGPAHAVPDRAAGERAGWLLDVLSGAGVEVGAHDLAAVTWLALWTPETVHVVGAWVARAGHRR